MEAKGERAHPEIAKAQFLLLMMRPSAKVQNIELGFCGCMEEDSGR